MKQRQQQVFDIFTQPTPKGHNSQNAFQMHALDWLETLNTGYVEQPLLWLPSERWKVRIWQESIMASQVSEANLFSLRFSNGGSNLILCNAQPHFKFIIYVLHGTPSCQHIWKRNVLKILEVTRTGCSLLLVNKEKVWCEGARVVLYQAPLPPIPCLEPSHPQHSRSFSSPLFRWASISSTYPCLSLRP